MQRKHYIDGPHAFIRSDSLELYYLEWNGRKWVKKIRKIDPTVERSISFDTKWTDTMIVKIRDVQTPMFVMDSTPARIMALSDLEGNFEILHALLKNNGIIDKNNNWSWSDGHLILLGDLLDRGSYVTESLWFLYKLQGEARKAGGNVHVVLGNHEVMIFNGDTRYVHSKYKKQSAVLDMEYEDWFTTNTIIGRWLRSQPAVVRLGDLLFTHAGISADVLALELSVERMNQLIIECNLNKRKVNEMIETEVLFGSNGIFWYREWVDDPPSESLLDSVLDFYQVKHMVIGHTIVPDISTRFNEKLITIDIQQPRSLESVQGKALLYENKSFFIASTTGDRDSINQ